MLLAATTLYAQQVTILPTHPSPGSVVRISLVEPDVVELRGEFGGEQIHFRRIEADRWHAVGAVPLEASKTVTGYAIAELRSGERDTVSITLNLPAPPPSRGRARARKLSVAPVFTRPLDAETEARVARENERARDVGRRSHDTPRMWSGSFIRPRSSAITARFGSGRMFNGTLAARHLGVDLRGSAGAPVVAANRGVVALVDRFFLAGNVVYIDHGNGIVTGYFHLSQTLVTEGDTVARGQKIGLVGATGRVTGPHLHWSARYGALTVNPLDLVAIGNW
ncbi:MAG TPA: M23 family metallopeptidase [Gemmatimonadaceae bacterium]|nr:M23 family metallopeptidase [Gemmatimonadaceae bacterium]